MKTTALVVISIFLSITAFAQLNHPVSWAWAYKKTGKDNAVVFLKASIQPGWHIYAIKNGGPANTKIRFDKSKNYLTVDALVEPQPIKKFEKGVNQVLSFYENEVVFQQKIKTTQAGATNVSGQLEYTACNNGKCTAPEEVNFSVAVR